MKRGIRVLWVYIIFNLLFLFFDFILLMGFFTAFINFGSVDVFSQLFSLLPFIALISIPNLLSYAVSRKRVSKKKNNTLLIVFGAGKIVIAYVLLVTAV